MKFTTNLWKTTYIVINNNSFSSLNTGVVYYFIKFAGIMKACNFQVNMSDFADQIIYINFV